MSITKTNGKLQQFNAGRLTNGPGLSGMKMWVTPPGQKKVSEELTAGRGNKKGQHTEAVINTSYGHVTSYRGL